MTSSLESEESADVLIRTFRDDDYPHFVEVRNRVCPDAASTVAELRQEDRVVAATQHRRERLLAEDGDGRILGYGQIQSGSKDRYLVSIGVDPTVRRHGGVETWALKCPGL